MIVETCIILVLLLILALIVVWAFFQSTNESFNNILTKNMPQVPLFNDLRGWTLPTTHAYTRYNDENLYDVISDTGDFMYESNFDPRNHIPCNPTTCPQSRDTHFCGDECLNCHRKH